MQRSKLAQAIIDEEGNGNNNWENIENQIKKYADRGLTLKEMIEIYTSISEYNALGYLHNVCKKINESPGALVSEILQREKRRNLV